MKKLDVLIAPNAEAKPTVITNEESLEFMVFMKEGFVYMFKKSHIMFNWCGYLGIPKEMAAHCGDLEELETHGSITYQEDHAPAPFDDNGWVIYHTPHPPKEYIWIGFDCCHNDDPVDFRVKIPELMEIEKERGGYLWPTSYKNMFFILQQLDGLKDQILSRQPKEEKDNVPE